MPQETLPLSTKSGTYQKNAREKIIFTKGQKSPTLAESILVGHNLVKEQAAEREVGDKS